MNKQVIYLVKTRNRKEFYVLATNTDEAFKKLSKHLEEEYGITKFSELGSIEVITEEEWESVFEPIQYK